MICSPLAQAGTPRYFDTDAAAGLKDGTANWNTTNAVWHPDSAGTAAVARVAWDNAAGWDAYFQTNATSTVNTSAANVTIVVADLFSVSNNTTLNFTPTGSGSQINFTGTALPAGPLIQVDQGSTLNWSATSTTGTPIGNVSPAIRPDLTIGRTSVFNLTNASTTGAKTVTLDALNTGIGENVLRVTNNHATNALTLSLLGLGTRATGGTLNIELPAGAGGPSSIVFATAGSPSQGFLNSGLFFQSYSYAAATGAANGAIRALNYGTDPDTDIAVTADKHVLLSSSVVGQTSVALRTLAFGGDLVDLSLSSGQTLSLTSGGLLKSGAGTSTISGGDGIGASGELIARVGQVASTLALDTPLNGTVTSLTKSGPGVLRLGAASPAFTGKTAIIGGVLAIEDENRLGAAPGALAADQLLLSSGGTLRALTSVTIDDANRGIQIGEGGGIFDVPAAGDTLILSEPISTLGGAVTRTMQKTGLGTLRLQGATANTAIGNFTVSAGTLELNKTSGVDAINGTLTIGGTGPAVVKLLQSNQISAQLITLNSNGVFDLNGFSDSVAGLNSTVGSGTLQNSGATNGTFTVTSTTNRTFNGLITDDFPGAGTLSFNKENNNTVTLGNLANTFRGALRAKNGTLTVLSLGNSGPGSNGEGTIQLSNNGSLPNSTPILNYTGVANADITQRPIDINAYSTTTPVIGQINASGAPGTLMISSVSTTTPTGAPTNITRLFTFNLSGNNTGDNTVTGAITEGDNPGGEVLSVSKIGAGKWILNGNSTYHGTTSVTAGTLVMNGTHVNGGAYSITGGLFGGSGSITTANNAGFTVGGTGQLAPGASAGTLAMNLGSGTLSVAGIGAGALVFELGANTPGSSDRVALTSGTLDIGTLDFSEFTFSTLSGFGVGDYVLFQTNSPIVGSIGSATGLVGGMDAELKVVGTDVILSVPEPGMIGLAGLVIPGLLARRRRRVAPR